ncbi:hypothetical protein LINGRAHAP2_LOCUS32612 [Linum grandiflorum]
MTRALEAKIRGLVFHLCASFLVFVVEGSVVRDIKYSETDVSGIHLIPIRYLVIGVALLWHVWLLDTSQECSVPVITSAADFASSVSLHPKVRRSS